MHAALADNPVQDSGVVVAAHADAKASEAACVDEDMEDMERNGPNRERLTKSNEHTQLVVATAAMQLPSTATADDPGETVPAEASPCGHPSPDPMNEDALEKRVSACHLGDAQDNIGSVRLPIGLCRICQRCISTTVGLDSMLPAG